VELIIPVLTYERCVGGGGQEAGGGGGGGLINDTLAGGNILPKCQSGSCEATHLTARARHTHSLKPHMRTVQRREQQRKKHVLISFTM